MKRRSFLASLLALPACLAVAAKVTKKPTARRVFFVDPCDVEWRVREYSGCSLTRATIQPLTPADIEAMANVETNLADLFQRAKEKA